ncbi:LPXTG cell wall anchor domain-containing protein [Kitasatospora sp. NPDC001539]|uniref:LPXTG cell wall anchor domain-containing protein n=1 Tax=Kitasatospora sp. NPDC001539 TaxID=3154384 RepID=UPI003318279D
MTDLIPRRARIWARGGLALACTAVLAVTGLPGLQGTAYAAKGKRCDEIYQSAKGAPQGTSFPWNKASDSVRDKSSWDTYDFDAPRQAFDGLTLPSDPAQQEEFLAQFDSDYEKYPENTKERVYARYKNYLTRDPQNTKYGTFEKWLSDAYILPNNNNRRGAFYEEKVVKDLGLVGPDWLCQEEIPILDKDGKPVIDPKTNKPLVRKFDAVNYRTNDFLEFKAGGGRDTTQDLANRTFLQDPQRKDARLTYVFGEEKKSATTKYLAKVNSEVGSDPANPRVRSYEHRSTGVPVSKFDPNTSKPDPYMNTGAKQPSGGAARNIEGSMPTPKDMAERMARIRAEDPTGLRVRGPGGVDFSTLQLSYVGKPVKGQALNYAFAAKKADEDEENVGWGGQEKAQLISDSFFTWLALTPDKFWVNLMPDQPDRIMDPAFGRTDAGRVLLQADLEMKHDWARDVDPRQGTGKKLWEAMQAEGLDCGPIERNWIVPLPARIRADENGVYILDAPLKVNSEAAVTTAHNPNGDCSLTEAQTHTFERLVREIVVPDIEHKVNTAPAYADLRRVYSARVAAEYVRQQDQQEATDYRSVINSNDVSGWPLRGANKGWTPRQTWEEYVKSFTQGDYSFPCGNDGRICVVGGVDFSQSPKQDIGATEFTAKHKDLPRSAQTSVKAMTDKADTDDLLLLGGGGPADTGPTPTPTPTDTPTPTATPTPTPTPTSTGTPTGTPTPTPTTAPSTPAATPAGDDGASPSPAPAGGSSGSGSGSGGSLASTGTDVLPLAGAAAALLAGGAAIVWWRRRRA